jgi:hypothetical protein
MATSVLPITRLHISPALLPEFLERCEQRAAVLGLLKIEAPALSHLTGKPGQGMNGRKGKGRAAGRRRVRKSRVAARK